MQRDTDRDIDRDAARTPHVDEPAVRDAAGPMVVRADGSERVRYDYPLFFSYMRRGSLARYPTMRADCHWHDDWEFLIAERGHLTYFVDGERVRIDEGQAIFVNARRLHYGYSADGTDCEFLCALLNPMRAGTPRDVLERHILPLGDDARPPYLLLSPATGAVGDAPGNAADGTPDAAAIISTLHTMADAVGSPTTSLTTLAGFYTIAERLTRLMDTADGRCGTDRSPSSSAVPATATATGMSGRSARQPRLQSLTAMVDFIQANYAHTITLAQIAAAGAVGRSTCATLFRRHLNQSPIEYVNDVRVRAAAELLAGTDLPVGAIAPRCGFNSPNFLARTFRVVTGETPLAYRHRTRFPG
ncbi:AraC family transcriptional regulator [Bifidobacterium samirii]|uniref:AraC family transcriptional regulator n=1 Tax=Bifidobacterium samirii TaxID=2306974 RepID=A0A430FV50_9BIFI|nr:AraC family transcriptional regulator [Bifidobacterium samirii]RSX57439.1 AraC family transcriptional regulator [Bifidobacterium samirii]